MTEASCQQANSPVSIVTRGDVDFSIPRHDALPKQLAFKGKESHAERDAAQSIAQARARAAFARHSKEELEYSQAMHLQALTWSLSKLVEIGKEAEEPDIARVQDATPAPAASQKDDPPQPTQPKRTASLVQALMRRTLPARGEKLNTPDVYNRI